MDPDYLITIVETNGTKNMDLLLRGTERIMMTKENKHVKDGSIWRLEPLGSLLLRPGAAVAKWIEK